MTVPQIDAITEGKHQLKTCAFVLHCWQCGAALAEMRPEPISSSQRCASCSAITECRQGIWCALAPSRLIHFEKFIAEYASIRAAEGRGSTNLKYYLSLPYKDVSGHNGEQWRIRARTFDTLLRKLITPLAKKLNHPLRILDLGAGNGWMSYRLALTGHLPVAVDLSTNAHDGLGASVNFSSQLPRLFPRVQAELDRLPFASASFDLAVFNASFHYSEDYERTLAEAMRCVSEGGSVVIADTPWYAKAESGKQMVAEKHANFNAVYGFPSDSVASLEFLTPERLQELEDCFNLEWQCIRPFYGFRWALRPLLAKLKGRRTPSHFRIFEAKVKA